jgi:hypothetical protein
MKGGNMVEIKFDTGNAAFDDYAKAVNHILLQVQDMANRIGEGERIHLPVTMKLMDGNGNSVGTMKFSKR